MNLNKIIALRKELHNNPEISMNEKKTKQILMNFIKGNTNLTIVDMGNWFYAYYHNTNSKKSIAFRADYDAVCGSDGKAQHLCGHDGHSAILAGLALEIEALSPNCDIYLIFQPGEETGEGAKICSPIIPEKGICEIYGLHNIPGFEENTIILTSDTFACASTGLEITIKGSVSHAAYPEAGKNPAKLISNTILYMHEQIEKPHSGIVLGTVIGVNLGSESYGVSAGNVTLRLTLRAEHQEEYNQLINNISDYVKALASSEHMECYIQRIEEFPATVNHKESVQKLKSICEQNDFSTQFAREPFRWSEDFGYYLQKTGGAFFGVGSGINHPQLHTDHYEFNDKIIPTAINLYKEIIKSAR